MNLVKGKKGEELALNYLREKQFQLVCRNFRCRVGEIDLIMLDQEILVFVEVKSRKNQKYGLPREAVTLTKQRKMRQVALFFLQRNGLYKQKCRFDVVEIYLDVNPERANHISNAF